MPTRTRNKKQTKPTKTVSSYVLVPFTYIKKFWKASIWQKVICILLAIVITFTAGMYGVGQWYIFHHKNEPLRIGATFIPDYATFFDLDPKETMQSMIDDLGIKQFRLVSYWKDIEKTEGIYDFSSLDWQFEKVAKARGKVSLAIGLRQPRWPECHAPDWAQSEPIEVWYPQLKNYMTAVINHYKDNPILESYQLENEFFMTVFGICPDHSRWRLVDEYNMVSHLDTNTPIIVSRSNNWVGLPLGDPRPSKFGISIYKRVWDKSITKRYFEYPMPAWFYSALAGGGEIATGNDMAIHELQVESWLPSTFDMKTAPIDEMYKSMNPERLKDRIRYGVATGMREVYLWGPEWWLYLKEKRNAPELWDTAKTELAKYRQQ